jgi:hypothetical protein
MKFESLRGRPDNPVMVSPVAVTIDDVVTSPQPEQSNLSITFLSPFGRVWKIVKTYIWEHKAEIVLQTCKPAAFGSTPESRIAIVTPVPL